LYYINVFINLKTQLKRMPCQTCGKRCTTQNLFQPLIYCVCKACNFCHNGGVCPDNKHWFLEIRRAKRKGIQRERKDPRQSHGGHGWIPNH
jgi:hypothetical protein